MWNCHPVMRIRISKRCFFGDAVSHTISWEECLIKISSKWILRAERYFLFILVVGSGPGIKPACGWSRQKVMWRSWRLQSTSPDKNLPFYKHSNTQRMQGKWAARKNSFKWWCVPVSIVTSGLPVRLPFVEDINLPSPTPCRITLAPPLGVPFEDRINLDQARYILTCTGRPLIPTVFIWWIS